MTPTIKYKGKMFVRLCNCNSDWGTDSEKNILIIDEWCSECALLNWIILPKEGK